MSETNTNRKYYSYVESNVVDDKDFLYDIVEAAGGEYKSILDLRVDVPEIIISIIMETFRVFKKKLQEKASSGYSRYKINVANRFEIGYDNAENEDYEKNGGFMFYIKHLYRESKNDNFTKEYEDDTITLASAWNSLNIKTDSKIINEVSAETISALKKLDIKIETPELVMPIVCIFYDNMIECIKIQRSSLKEFELTLNVASIFDVRVMEGDDGDDIITFTPSIEYKLGLKDDAQASSRYDYEE